MKLKDLIQMAAEEARKRMEEIGLAKEYTGAEKEDIARKVGQAAIKFADLINHRTSDYTFDLQKFTLFEGKTGPYMLYAAVRIKSILRKAGERGLKPGPLLPPGDSERELALELTRFSDAVRKSAAHRAPNHLCEFAFELSQVFSHFYQQCHILNEPDAARQASWLALAGLCLRELEQALDLMGLEVPQRM
jgi:arginyl-tRNA synthetase